jgi:hypothetical protein
MTTGKAAVFFGPGRPFEIREFALPDVNQAFAESEWHAKETTSITRAALAP